MEKAYSRNIFAVAWNLLALACGVILAFLVLGRFFGMVAGLLGSGLLAVAMLADMLSHLRMRVVVRDTSLSIFKGREEWHFDLGQVALRAESSNGQYLTLKVVEADGAAHDFDLTLLGVSQYQQLLEDLGVTGERSAVTRLEAEKKQ